MVKKKSDMKPFYIGIFIIVIVATFAFLAFLGISSNKSNNDLLFGPSASGSPSPSATPIKYTCEGVTDKYWAGDNNGNKNDDNKYWTGQTCFNLENGVKVKSFDPECSDNKLKAYYCDGRNCQKRLSSFERRYDFLSCSDINKICKTNIPQGGRPARDLKSKYEGWCDPNPNPTPSSSSSPIRLA